MHAAQLLHGGVVGCFAVVEVLTHLLLLRLSGALGQVELEGAFQAMACCGVINWVWIRQARRLQTMLCDQF
jgi:hypothetical protein